MKKALIIIAVLVFNCLFLDAQIINIPSDYPTIQQGIDAANDGDTVLVQPGVYYEHVFFDGFDKYVVLGSLFLTTNDTSYISQTIIDGSNYGLPCIRYVFCTDSCEIAGFTLQNGYTGSDGYGAAIHCRQVHYGGSQPVSFHNLKIKDNNGQAGAIVNMSYGISRMKDCELFNNITNGSVLYNFRSYGSFIENVSIHNNTGNRIIDFIEGSRSELKNLLLFDNNAVISVYTQDSPVWIKNTTVVNNNSTYGLYVQGGSPKLLNSIFSGHGQYNIYCVGGVTYIDNSIIEYGYDSIWRPYPGALQYGTNNLSVTPEFVDPENGNFQLADCNSGIGAGAFQVIMAEDTLNAPTYDILNNPRPQPIGSNPDIGAYENVLGFPANSIGQPSVASATNITDSSFVAHWNTPINGSAPNGYRLDIASDITFNSILTSYNDLDVGDVLSATVSGLSSATEYFYRIRSYGDYGTSINSGTMNVVTSQSVDEHMFINYQAILRDSLGAVISDTTVNIQFSLTYSDSPNIFQYVEHHQISTNQFGLLNCKLGNGTATTGYFSTLNWQNNKILLKVDIIDGQGGIVNIGTEELSYVPYSMHSLTTSDTTFNTLTITNGNLEIDQPDAGMILKSPDGTSWKVTIDNSGNLISVQVPGGE